MHSIPENARVYIDSEFSGVTPLKLKGLEPQRIYAVDAGSELEVTEEREAEADTLVDALDRGYGRPPQEERSAG